jgi:type I restriction enzyme, S subunit
MKNGASTSNGWKTVRLAEIDRHVHRTLNPLDYPDEVFEYYSIPAFQASGKPTLERGEAILSNKLLVESRMILFGKLNPEVLKVWLVDSESEHRKIASTEFLPVLATENAHPEFLYYLCQSSLVVKEAKQLVSGSTPSRQRVEARSFYNIVVPLPPLPEQRAIAHILRAVQAAREARQREVSLERERKAALMAHLFTHGTRGEPTKQTPMGEIPKSWGVTTIGDIAEFLQYGTSRECTTEPIGMPVLRIPNVIGGKVDTGDLKYLELQGDEADRLRLAVGDILFVRTNGRREYTGRCAVFMGEPEEASFASYLIRARLKPDTLLPQFAQFYATTPRGSSYLAGRASNAADGKFNINTQTINSVLVPQPSLDEQGEIVEVINACDAKIAALERESALLEELFRALLEELMTGRVAVAGVGERNG